jgi:hypothetical protein
MLEGGGTPGISRLVLPEADLWAHECRACATPGRLAQEHLMPLSWYRQRPWERSTPA